MVNISQGFSQSLNLAFGENLTARQKIEAYTFDEVEEGGLGDEEGGDAAVDVEAERLHGHRGELHLRRNQLPWRKAEGGLVGKESAQKTGS